MAQAEGARLLGSEAVGVWPGRGLVLQKPQPPQSSTAASCPPSTAAISRCPHLGGAGVVRGSPPQRGWSWVRAAEGLLVSRHSCLLPKPATFFLSQAPSFVSAKRGLVFPERVLLFPENKQTPACHHPHGRRDGGGKWTAVPVSGRWGLRGGQHTCGTTPAEPPFWGSTQSPSEAGAPHGEQHSWPGRCFDTKRSSEKT